MEITLCLLEEKLSAVTAAASENQQIINVVVNGLIRLSTFLILTLIVHGFVINLYAAFPSVVREVFEITQAVLLTDLRFQQFRARKPYIRRK